MVKVTWHKTTLPLQRGFIQPTRVKKPNSISVCSAIFAQLTRECPRACLILSAKNCSFTWVDVGLHLIHGSFSPPTALWYNYADMVIISHCHVRMCPSQLKSEPVGFRFVFQIRRIRIRICQTITASSVQAWHSTAKFTLNTLDCTLVIMWWSGAAACTAL